MQCYTFTTQLSPIIIFLKKNLRLLSTLSQKNVIKEVTSEDPELDFDYLCSPNNTQTIKRSITNRKERGDIDKVIYLHNELQKCNDSTLQKDIRQNLICEALKIPNTSHPSLKNLNNEPKIVKTINNFQELPFKPLTFEILVKRLKLIKTKNLTTLAGPRSYFLIDGLAKLEDALIQYTLRHLLDQQFQIISVPDLLPRKQIEYCGMDTAGERTQVFSLDDKYGEDICLSGTAEMGIAYSLKGKTFSKTELPLKLAAVSRCFRAETSKISVEKGIYRVHQFTKVEMFGVSTAVNSDLVLEEFLNIQELLFNQLGLNLRVLEMPECELGAQAYRKYDIESYMPGKDYWGELSSASNCTDYQSRRLGIKCDDGTFVHTLNGTACAVPRLLIAIVETFQDKNGNIQIPEVLVPYMECNMLNKSEVPKLVPFTMYK